MQYMYMDLFLYLKKQWRIWLCVLHKKIPVSSIQVKAELSKVNKYSHKSKYLYTLDIKLFDYSGFQFLISNNNKGEAKHNGIKAYSFFISPNSYTLYYFYFQRSSYFVISDWPKNTFQASLIVYAC